jgi:predicted small secreted protein
MKTLQLAALLIAVLGLSNCNTLIGAGRDIREGYNWTAEKVRRGGGQQEYDYGAPVY